MLTAFNVKTKEKGVPILNAIITKKVNGKRTTYIASGDNGKGDKLTAILSEAKANEAIEKGLAKKSGW